MFIKRSTNFLLFKKNYKVGKIKAKYCLGFSAHKMPNYKFLKLGLIKVCFASNGED